VKSFAENHVNPYSEDEPSKWRDNDQYEQSQAKAPEIRHTFEKREITWVESC
jgi:hypothetical protein